MTTTNKCDILIEQGTDWAFDFPIDPTIPLDGTSAAMMIRTPCGATYIATLTTANGGLIIDAAANVITAILNNLATSAFVPGEYVYDIKAKDTNNIVYRTNEGNAIVDGQVTNILPPDSGGIGITTEDGQAITTEDNRVITTS